MHQAVADGDGAVAQSASNRQQGGRLECGKREPALAVGDQGPPERREGARRDLLWKDPAMPGVLTPDQIDGVLQMRLFGYTTHREC